MMVEKNGAIYFIAHNTCLYNIVQLRLK